MKAMKIIKEFIALTATLIGMIGWAGDSAPFLLDTIEPLVETGEEVSFSYNSSWVGGDSSAEIVISADGTEIKRTTGDGDFAWAPTTPGKHTLTYTTYINGVAQEEVYTATVYADWKYTVEDGKATIVETTQKSGSVTSVGTGAFDGCTGIRSVSLSPTFKIRSFNTGLIQAKFNSSDDFTSSIIDSESKSLVSGVLMGDAYDTESVTRTYTDPKYGGSYQWNSVNTTFGYTGYMYMVEGRTYVFGKYFDDSVLVRIDGIEVLKNTWHIAFATGKYVPEETGWHEIEVRVADGYGEKGPKGMVSSGYWSGNLGVGWRDDGITDALPESGWKKMMDPGDGSLFRCLEEVQDLTMRGLFADSYDKLTSVTLIGDAAVIANNAFAGCVALESFTIPDSVYSIGANAFANCTGLTKVSMPFPLKVQVESGNVFDGCSENLEIVYRSAEITDVVAKQRFPWNGKVDITYNVTGNIAAGLPEWNRPVLVLSALDRTTGSNYVAQISALSGDTGIEEGEHHVVWDLNAQNLQIKSDDMVFTIIVRTLSNMNGERSTEAVSGAERAGEFLCLASGESTKIDLRNEPLLDSIDLSYNSGWIGGDSSAEVVISADGTEIKRTTGEGEFAWAPTTPGKHTLTYTTYINGVAQEEVYTATVYADWKYTVEDGKATIVATTQKSGSVTIPSKIDGFPVVGLGDGLFDECEGLTSVLMPDSVTSIGNYTFRGCSGLASVTIPDSVTSIGDYAFEDCVALTEIIVRDSFIDIGIDAFTGCTNLTNVMMPARFRPQFGDELNGCPITYIAEIQIGNGIWHLACDGWR